LSEAERGTEAVILAVYLETQMKTIGRILERLYEDFGRMLDRERMLALLMLLVALPVAHANEYTALATRAAAELQAEQAAKELRADLYREQAEQAAQQSANLHAAIDAAIKPLQEEIAGLRAAAVVKEPEPKDERPIVTVYKADFACPPCERMKKEADQLPVKPSFQEPTKAVKEWIDKDTKNRGYPVIHYQIGEKWYYHSGYNGVDDFKKWWTEKNARGTKLIQPYSSNAYTPHWTWPGNLAQHLRDTHGINPSGMSQDQMEQAHDRSHDGGFRAPAVQHASGGFLNFGRRRGGCPNGMCPR
jgi:hypothetical protein